MVRYGRLIELANENVACTSGLAGECQCALPRRSAAGEGDLEQVRERVEAAIAVQAQFRQQYDEARGVFRRAIGIEPHNLRAPADWAACPRERMKL